MKRKFIKGLFFATLLALSLVSCSHYEEIQADIEESKSGDDESHNPGKNCGSCHNQSGNEAAREYWWIISGTVFNSNNNGEDGVSIELWQKPNQQGALIKRLASDELGNFYTNEILDFNGGCYPVIKKGNKIKQMGTIYNGGSCNSCHGISTNKLTID